jgi:rod shape-determining protein MreC
VRLLVLAVLSVTLMVVDARFTVLKPVRSQMSLVLMQSYWIADLPQRLYQGVASQFGSRTELIAENEKLKTEALLLQGRLQKLAALTEQNVRLRELLNSSAGQREGRSGRADRHGPQPLHPSHHHQQG